MFNLVRLSLRLLNIGTTICEALYKQAQKFVQSKIKSDNSPGPKWLEYMCSIDIITIIIIIIIILLYDSNNQSNCVFVYLSILYSVCV